MGRWDIARVDDVHVVTMTSNKVNAMNDEFFTDLQAAIVELQSSETLPVVLTGSYRCFCAGLDLRELYDFDRTTLAAFVDRLDETVLAWFSLPRPTVAALNGHAIAGGCVLALSCDVRVSVDRDATIGLNEVQVGIPFPAVPLTVSRFALSLAHAREVLLFGGLYSPGEAAKRGKELRLPFELARDLREGIGRLEECPKAPRAPGLHRSEGRRIGAPAADGLGQPVEERRRQIEIATGVRAVTRVGRNDVPRARDRDPVTVRGIDRAASPGECPGAALDERDRERVEHAALRPLEGHPVAVADLEAGEGGALPADERAGARRQRSISR